MSKTTILWADDEISLLKPQVMFLQDKGYDVVTVSNGKDAIAHFEKNRIDVVLLDESMPGLSGLQTLTRIKEINQHVPVVMITKNEEDNLMEEAIGAQIADYLIKPVKPQQILSALKKILNKSDLVSEKTVNDYRSKFQELFMRMQEKQDFKGWVDLYKDLVFWEGELEKTTTNEMQEILESQKQEANLEFTKYVVKNYKQWFTEEGMKDAPLMSHTLLRAKLPKLLKEDKPTILILIDNLRFDQWRAIQPFFLNQFRIEEEDTFCAILPTATQYSRNAIFSGQTPLMIQKQFPDKWLNDDDEGGKNLYEDFFLEHFLKRTFSEPILHQYIKVTTHKAGQELEGNILNHIKRNKLTVIVYNFVDMLSHARTEMEVLKELASDEAAYRSLAVSWFEHSPLQNAIKKLAGKDVNVLLTTDHGTVRVKNASKCMGDRQTSTNIRYKMGKNINFEEKDVYAVRNPEEIQLPKSNMTSTYIFAKEDKYLIYPNNYNHFVQFFKNTFQHGGISLEEMIVPVVTMTSK